MIKIESKVVEQEREPLFEIEGTEYTVPKGNFPAEFALQYMDYVDKFGLDSATVWLMEHGLSEGGWVALKGVSGLDPEVFAQILTALQTKVMGSLSEAPKGKLKAV